MEITILTITCATILVIFYLGNFHHFHDWKWEIIKGYHDHETDVLTLINRGTCISCGKNKLKRVST